MPNAGFSHDLVLKTVDGTTKVGLSLWRESGALTGGYRKEIVPVSGPRLVGGGQASYDELSPERGLVYEQQSFHRGFGQTFAQRRGTDDFRYGTADGVLAHFENTLVSGYREDYVDILIRNGSFEDTDDVGAGWTETNATLAASASARSGKQALQITLTANNGTVSQDYAGGSTGLGSVFTGAQITVYAYARRVSGTGSLTLRVTGDSSGNTDSTATTSTSLSLLQVTKTLTGDTTFTITLLGSTSGDVWVVDDVMLMPPGGIDFPSRHAEIQGLMYIPCGRMVLKWDSTDSAFYAVYLDPSYAVKTIREFGGALYIGFGTNQSYKRSLGGTSWSNPTTATGDNSHADFFAVGRNANGDEALFKIRANQVSVTTDPSDSANWGAEIPVGSVDKDVTSFAEGNDSVYVGKEDGILAYDRVNSQFRNMAPAAAFFAHPDNFVSVIERGGDIYAGISGQAFWRITDNGPGAPTRWQELSHLIKANAYAGFSGTIGALTQDMNNLWVGLEDGRLLALRRDRASGNGELVPHVITQSAAEGTAHTHQLARYNTGALERNLFIFTKWTSTSNTARVIRLRIPVDDENPLNAASPEVRTEGYVAGQWIDFFYPDTEKALVKVTVQSRGLVTDSQYIDVDYKLDDDGADDSTGWTSLGRVDTSPVDTLTASLNPAVTFRRIRLRFTLVTDDTTVPVEMNGYTLHAVFNPVESNKWTVQTLLSDRVRRRGGLRAKRKSGLSSAERASLDSMRKLPFVKLEDIDGSEKTVKIRQVQDDYFDVITRDSGAMPRKTLATQIEMIEVLTT